MATRVSASRLIGRAGELAELSAAFDEAAGGAASLAFLAGESGVGKSRLLHTFLDRAAERGGCALGGECVELGRDELPYAPLVAALRGLQRERDPVLDGLSPATRAGLAQLVPELDPEATVDPDDDRHRPFEALLSLLEALAEDTPMILWLDDAHWADHATRGFLAFLAASLPDECRLLTVIAYRSDQLHRRHPMRPLLAELGRGRRVRRLELSPFDRGEVATQLSDILGAMPESEAVDRFFERSEGNPLFTEELLAAGSDGRGRLPSTLRDALLLRIERLPETARGLLDPRCRRAPQARPLRRRLRDRRGRAGGGPARGGRGAGGPGRQGRPLRLPPRAAARGDLRRPAAGRTGRTAPAAGAGAGGDAR